ERVLSTRIFDSSESSANKITIAGSVWASRSSSDSVEYEMTGRDSKAPMLILMHSHRNSRLSMTATKPPGLPRRPHSLIPSPILRGRDSTFAQVPATEASEFVIAVSPCKKRSDRWTKDRPLLLDSALNC